MTLKNRIAKLEKQHPTITSTELSERINLLLAQAHLVSPSAYNRIVELLKIVQARKAEHEQHTQPNQ